MGLNEVEYRYVREIPVLKDTGRQRGGWVGGEVEEEHYNDVIMGAMASQINGVSIVYSTVCSGADQGKYQSSASMAFVMGIHR